MTASTTALPLCDICGSKTSFYNTNIIPFVAMAVLSTQKISSESNNLMLTLARGECCPINKLSYIFVLSIGEE